MAKEISYNDGMEPGRRTPRLYIFKPGHAPVRFKGESIPGIATIVAKKFKKNGMWSNTDYTIAIGDNTVALRFLKPLHGKEFFPDYSSVHALMTKNHANKGLAHDLSQLMSEADFMSFLESEFPITFRKFGEAQSALSALD